MAATLFLRRGVSGRPWLCVHSLELNDVGWQLVGGGGGTGRVGEFDQRLSLAELGDWAVCRGRGWSARRRATLTTPSAVGISWTEVRTAIGVGALLVDGRVLPVADHGLAVVVWNNRAPSVTVLDQGGKDMGPMSMTFRYGLHLR